VTLMSESRVLLSESMSATEEAAWEAANKRVLWGWKRDRDRFSRTVFLEARLSREGTQRLLGSEIFFSYRTRVSPDDAERLARHLRQAVTGIRDLGFSAESWARRQNGHSVLELDVGSPSEQGAALLQKLRRRRPRTSIASPTLPPSQPNSSLSRWLPADLYVGSGVSYEAGLPTLCDMHERFGVDQADGQDFAFGLEDHLPQRLADDPQRVLRSFFDVHAGALRADPTPALHRIARLVESGQIRAVYTDNVDNLLAKVGLPFERVRGSGVLNERHPVTPKSDRLIVVGVAADRRDLVQQYRAAGAEIVVVNPVETVSPNVTHLDYLRTTDPFFRTTAHEFFAALSPGEVPQPATLVQQSHPPVAQGVSVPAYAGAGHE
jgi:hypothetical protein